MIAPPSIGGILDTGTAAFRENPIGYLVGHVEFVAGQEHVDPVGILTTQGASDRFTNERAVVWRLDPIDGLLRITPAEWWDLPKAVSEEPPPGPDDVPATYYGVPIVIDDRIDPHACPLEGRMATVRREQEKTRALASETLRRIDDQDRALAASDGDLEPRTLADDVAEFAERVGMPLMPWQRDLVDQAFEQDPDGRFTYRPQR